MLRCIGLLLTILGLSVLSCGQDFAVRNARVFDGERVFPQATVIVRGGVIRSLSADPAVERGLPIVDGSGKTLLPGLIDAHTHVFDLKDLRQALVFGVTTELDMHGSPAAIRAWKLLDQEHRVDYSDIRFAGFSANAPAGKDFDYPVPAIHSPEEAQAFVDARLAEGSDYIKIIYNAGAPTPGPGTIATPAVSKETMAALVSEAHRRGKQAIVHISFESAAREALEAGADGLAHLFIGNGVQPGLGALAKQHGAFVVPTLSVLLNVCGRATGGTLADDDRIAPLLLPAAARVLRQTVLMRRGRPRPSCESLAPAIRQLLDAGVPVLAGTDVGNAGLAHGASVHGELSLLVEHGLSPLQALSAATSLTADAFHLNDRGRIAPGKRADMVLVSGDPGRDITATRALVEVWKDGRRVDRQGFQRNMTQLSKADVPRGLAAGLISDFDGAQAATRFGSEWQVFDGVTVARVAGGAQGSPGAIAMTVEGSVATWPGIAFAPSGIPQAPADMSSMRGVSIWAKGDGDPLRIALVSVRGRYEASIRPGRDWQRFEIPFPSENFDSAQFLHLIIAAGSQAKRSEYFLDDISFF